MVRPGLPQAAVDACAAWLRSKRLQSVAIGGRVAPGRTPRNSARGTHHDRSVIATANAPPRSALLPGGQGRQHGVRLRPDRTDPASMQMVEGFDAQTEQVFRNLKGGCEAAGGTLATRSSSPSILPTSATSPKVNEVMASHFSRSPYPARAAVGVKELPGVRWSRADAILVLGWSPVRRQAAKACLPAPGTETPVSLPLAARGWRASARRRGRLARLDIRGLTTCCCTCAAL